MDTTAMQLLTSIKDEFKEFKLNKEIFDRLNDLIQVKRKKSCAASKA